MIFVRKFVFYLCIVLELFLVHLVIECRNTILLTLKGFCVDIIFFRLSFNYFPIVDY